ncbi:superinfection immunity protein [Pelagibacterium montanilacus]|uniref:superinfection immunity protein n=1 Tax=Pelagibacterium montanilacus TaxID=2185280 RepID=UPI0019D0909B
MEIGLLLLAYFLPSLIAVMRGHQSWGAVLALNALLGWTVLGWIGAFVWAFVSVQKPSV